MAKSSSKVQDFSHAVTDNPYIRRLVEDEELRDNIISALKSAKRAYNRVADGKQPAKKLMDDRKVHRDLRDAADALREATDQLRGRKRRKAPWAKLLLIGILGIVLALIFSEDLRNAVLDRLLPPEEEFEFTASVNNGDVDVETD
jgi:hypothetical protein